MQSFCNGYVLPLALYCNASIGNNVEDDIEMRYDCSIILVYVSLSKNSYFLIYVLYLPLSSINQ